MLSVSKLVLPVLLLLHFNSSHSAMTLPTQSPVCQLMHMLCHAPELGARHNTRLGDGSSSVTSSWMWNTLRASLYLEDDSVHCSEHIWLNEDMVHSVTYVYEFSYLFISGWSTYHHCWIAPLEQPTSLAVWIWSSAGCWRHACLAENTVPRDYCF